MKGFNGAAFFQSGKSDGIADSVQIGTASMEPLFFKAENVRPGKVNILPVRRFNGAAFFQSGKSVGWNTVSRS